MDSRKHAFLVSVLGPDGAGALAKASEKSVALGNALVPRAIMSWVTAVGRAYEGQIPGQPTSHLRFAKSEQGYAGTITINNEVYDFEGATSFHVGACVAVSVGSHEERVDVGLRDIDLARLGKSIDLLVRGRLVPLAKQAPQQPAAQRHGVAAQPLKPKQPDALPGPQKQPRQPSIKPPTSTGYTPPPPKLTPPKVKLPGAPKLAPLKIAKSASGHPCKECGLPQFSSASQFRGCLCFRSMAKSVSVRDTGEWLELAFGGEWDFDARTTLLETMGVIRG